MSRPRQILPGSTYLITRRVTQRHFFLRPSDEVNQIFLYCLALAAEKYGVLIHAVTAMSTHYHLTLTDPFGALPRFEQWLNQNVARAINASLGRWESFWAPGSYSCVRLETPRDTIDKMLYSAINPVSAGLVPQADQWPGVHILPTETERTITVQRPERFFNPRGSLPAEAKLTIVAPEPPEGMTTAEVIAELTARIEAEEKRIQAEYAREGRQFLGREAILAQDPFGRPNTHEPRRQLNPRIACKDKWLRIEAIQREQAFQREYRAAYERYQAGDHDAVFPPGTYWMKQQFDVRVAPG